MMALSFGANLKAWRKHRGLTQSALASRVGTSLSFIAQLEGGARKFAQDTLTKLAAALEASPGELIDYTPTGAEKIRRAAKIAQLLEETESIEAARVIEALRLAALLRETEKDN